MTFAEKNRDAREEGDRNVYLSISEKRRKTPMRRKKGRRERGASHEHFPNETRQEKGGGRADHQVVGEREGPQQTIL